MACLSETKSLIEKKDLGELKALKEVLLKELFGFSRVSEDTLRLSLFSGSLNVQKDTLADFSIPAFAKENKFAALKLVVFIFSLWLIWTTCT